MMIFILILESIIDFYTETHEISAIRIPDIILFSGDTKGFYDNRECH